MSGDYARPHRIERTLTSVLTSQRTQTPSRSQREVSDDSISSQGSQPLIKNLLGFREIIVNLLNILFQLEKKHVIGKMGENTNYTFVSLAL